MQTWHPGDRTAALQNRFSSLQERMRMSREQSAAQPQQDRVADFRKKQAKTQTCVCVSAAEVQQVNRFRFLEFSVKDNLSASAHISTLVQKKHRNGSTSHWNRRRFNSGARFLFLCATQDRKAPQRVIQTLHKYLLPFHSTTEQLHSLLCGKKATIFYYITTIQLILNPCAFFFPPHFIIRLVCLKSQRSSWKHPWRKSALITTLLHTLWRHMLCTSHLVRFSTAGSSPGEFVSVCHRVWGGGGKKSERGNRDGER